MTRAQILQELYRVRGEIDDLIECVSEPEQQPARYEKTKYFREVYGIKTTTQQTRRDAIREWIRKGRYPSNSFMGNLLDKAVYYDYVKNKKNLSIYPKSVPPYDPEISLKEALRLERERIGNQET